MKTFVFKVPVQEIWVVEVQAKTEEEAWEILSSGGGSQTCSIAGTTKSGDAELDRVLNTKR